MISFRKNVFLTTFILILCVSFSTRTYSMDDYFPKKTAKIKNAKAILVSSSGDILTLANSVWLNAKLKARYENGVSWMHFPNENNDKSDRTDSENEFKEAISSAVKDGNTIDVYIAGHSNGGRFDLAKKLPREYKSNIRLIYNTGCFDGSKYAAKYWLRGNTKKADKAYVGHVGSSSSFIFLDSFLDNWASGMRLQEAVKKANDFTSDDLENDEIRKFLFNWISGKEYIEIAKKGSVAIFFGDPKISIRTQKTISAPEIETIKSKPFLYSLPF